MDSEYNIIKTYLQQNKLKLSLNDFPKLFNLISTNTIVKETSVIYNILTSLLFKKQIYNNPKELIIPSKYKDTHNSFLKLCAVPIVEQRSQEWYLMRHNMITASSCADALGLNKYRKKEVFMFEKCLPDPPFQKNVDTHHGCKYEPIATMIYEEVYDTQVKEFGLIPHPDINFIGASPDGISTCFCKKNPNKFNNKYGTMLEIKCPRTRNIKKEGNINGDICPVYYYIQVQVQLEVCDLEICDFWQCTLKEYSTREEWWFDNKKELSIDTTTKIENSNLLKGAIIELLPLKPFANDEACLFDAKYIYPPTINMSCIEYELWINSEINNMYKLHPELYKKYIFHKVIYWHLDVVHNQPIKRDRNWFNSALPELKHFWDQVLHYRNNPNEIKNIIKKPKFEDL